MTRKVNYTSNQFTMEDLRKIVEDNKEMAATAKVNVRYYSGGYGGETGSSTIEIVES